MAQPPFPVADGDCDPTLVGVGITGSTYLDYRWNKCDTTQCSSKDVSGSCYSLPGSEWVPCGVLNLPPQEPPGAMDSFCHNCLCKVRTVHVIDDEHPENTHTYQECGCCNTRGCDVVYIYKSSTGPDVIVVDHTHP